MLNGLAIVSMLGFFAVGAAVAVRLLLLYRRTRGRPELALGCGLAATVLAIPASTAGVALGLGGPLVERGLFVVGAMGSTATAVAFFAFTQLVFYPGSRWARVLLAAVAAVALAGGVGLAHAKLADWGLTPNPATVPWLLTLLGLVALGLGWTGLEALRYWWRLRRRLALGLADPVVVNRFLLWAVGTLVAVSSLGVIAACKLAGLVIVSHPIPRLATGTAGMALALTWYLTFLPPERYLAWVRGRTREA